MSNTKVDMELVSAITDVLQAVDTSDTIDKPREKVGLLHELLLSRGYNRNFTWKEAVIRAFNV